MIVKILSATNLRKYSYFHTPLKELHMYYFILFKTTLSARDYYKNAKEIEALDEVDPNPPLAEAYVSEAITDELIRKRTVKPNPCKC